MIIPDKDKGVVCQSHGGNLYEHSEWSTLQVIQWFEEDNKLTESLDIGTAKVCAYFHDIGKGGDCIKNMYDPSKYRGKGEQQHPLDSGDMILGKKEYNFCNGNKININKLIKDLYPNIDTKVVALTAYMHWEFGKLNIPGVDPNEQNEEKLNNLSIKINDYLNLFRHFCDVCGLTPNDYLLKMCILIACADISSGTNIRLKKNKKVPKQKYISKDPWVLFKMDKRYLFYREKVLNQFNKSKTSFGRCMSDYTYLKSLK